LDPEVKEIAWKAQWRLHTRYKKLAAAGKKKPQIVTAVGRELLAFCGHPPSKPKRSSDPIERQPNDACHFLLLLCAASPPPVQALRSFRLAALGLDWPRRRCATTFSS